jgi:hypothetical protein
MNDKTESASLLAKKANDKKAAASDWKNSVLLKTATFGLNGLFFAAHLVLNGKFLASLGSEGPSLDDVSKFKLKRQTRTCQRIF